MTCNSHMLNVSFFEFSDGGVVVALVDSRV